MQIFYLTLIDARTAILLYQQVIWSSIQVYCQKAAYSVFSVFTISYACIFRICWQILFPLSPHY